MRLSPTFHQTCNFLHLLFHTIMCDMIMCLLYGGSLQFTHFHGSYILLCHTMLLWVMTSCSLIGRQEPVLLRNMLPFSVNHYNFTFILTQLSVFFFYFGLGFQFHNLPPGSTAASMAYCTIPRFSKRSYFGRQVPLASTTAVVPQQAKEELWARNGGQMVPRICTQGSFFTCRKSAIWDR